MDFPTEMIVSQNASLFKKFDLYIVAEGYQILGCQGSEGARAAVDTALAI